MKVTGRSALVQVAASTQQMTAHAGLLLVRELADRLGVPALLDTVSVKKRRRGYSPSQQLLALCETLIAGGECLDEAAMLRADAAQEQLRGHAVPDPTTLGRFLRSFSLGHIGQLNRALDELFRRVQPLVARERVTLDLDATLVEHHGPAGSRQGTCGTYTARWPGTRCSVLSPRRASGCTASCAPATRRPRPAPGASWPSACGAYLRGRGSSCAPTRASSARTSSPSWKRRQITYAVGAPLLASLRTRIAAIAEDDWQPSSYRGGSEVASLLWQPKSWKQARRFIVRRDPVAQGEQLSLEGAEWHYWALVSNDRERTADELESWQRGKANVENRIKEAKLGLGLDNLPCASFHANSTYLLCTLLAYNLLAWLKLLALPEGERGSYAKRLRFRFIAVAGSVGRSGRRLILRLSAGYPLLAEFIGTLERIRALARAPA